MRYDFIIYGSGISGKITAIALANSGFKICLISEKNIDLEKPETNLVTFLSNGSLGYLCTLFSKNQNLFKYEEINKIKCQLNSTDGGKKQLISFNNQDNQYLGKVIKNVELELLLNSELGTYKNIEIKENYKATCIENKLSGVRLKFENGDTFVSKLLILSSSKSQAILNSLKINFIKQDFFQYALSVTVKGTLKNKNCAFQYFTQDGPFAILPYLADEASIVWSIKSNSELLKKNETEISNEIISRITNQIDNPEIISIEKHKLKFNFAKRLTDNNTVLLGNIAHNIHPIAGQGLNLSIKDIALFTRTVSKFKKIGYEFYDQNILKKFDSERKLDNAAYSFGTFTLEGILSSKNKYLNLLARKGIWLTERSSTLKNIFIKSATGKDFFKTF